MYRRTGSKFRLIWTFLSATSCWDRSFPPTTAIALLRAAAKRDWATGSVSPVCWANRASFERSPGKQLRPLFHLFLGSHVDRQVTLPTSQALNVEIDSHRQSVFLWSFRQ